jgi:alkylhydroperoxidase family enzyme
MNTRIAPVIEPYEPEVADQLRSMMPEGVPPIGLFRTFARNMDMTKAMSGWGRYELGRNLSLTMRQREIVIDRTCARCGCEYEWGVHLQFYAERVGFTERQLTSLTHGQAADPGWPADEALLIRAVDELHDTSEISDALWTELITHFEGAQLLDLTMLCGWYHAISFTARTARVASEPGAPVFADYLPSTGHEKHRTEE